MTMTKLHELVYENFDVFGSEPAVVFDDGDDFSVITYNALRSQAETLKSEFSKLGVRDSVVGVLLDESPCIPAVLLGLLSNDCPFFPLSSSGARYIEDRVAAVGVSHIVVHQRYCQEIIGSLGQARCKEKTSQVLQGLGLQLLHLQDSEKPDSQSGDQSEPVCCGLAYCITTSGSTSKPKAVRVPHACIVPNIVQLRQVYQLGPGEKVFKMAPLTFDTSIIDIFCTLSSGACLVMVPASVKLQPDKLLEILSKRQEVTVMQATPCLVKGLGPWRLQQTIFSRDSKLRLLSLAGEPFPKGSELRTWLSPGNKTNLYNLYGITEISCYATWHKVDRDALLEQDQPVPIGEVLTETLIKLLPLSDEPDTPEDVTDKSEQEVGKIMLGSSTRVCIIDDEPQPKPNAVVWRETGDVATVDSAGNIYCLGRLDTQVKRHGKRLNLKTVEQVLEELPGVRNCQAIYHGTTLALFVILTQDQNESDSVDRWTSVVTKLQAHARHALPHHGMPDVFIEIKDEFPLTVHGKVDKKELKCRIDALEKDPNGVSA